MRTLRLNPTPNSPSIFHKIHALPVSLVAALCGWLAVLIYAASNPIVSMLVDIGEANLVGNGRNAITYGNLLILGSIISLLPISLLNRRDLTKRNVRQLSRRQWLILAVSALLSSALTPGLVFFALENTTVTNMVLIGRIEPPLFLLATWIFLRERLNVWAFGAGILALFGAVLMLYLNGSGNRFSFGIGEIATVGATISYICSSLVARLGLKDIPVGIFMVVRTILGTGIYFALTTCLFGIEIYRDIFSSVLLKWVWIYAIIVIVIGQLLLSFALKHARSGDLSMATSFSPVAALIMAMLLLGEDPGAGLLPGGAIILLSIAIGQCGEKIAGVFSREVHAYFNPTLDLTRFPVGNDDVYFWVWVRAMNAAKTPVVSQRRKGRSAKLAMSKENQLSVFSKHVRSFKTRNFTAILSYRLQRISHFISELSISLRATRFSFRS